jgi:hypothetical protein
MQHLFCTAMNCIKSYLTRRLQGSCCVRNPISTASQSVGMRKGLAQGAVTHLAGSKLPNEVARTKAHWDLTLGFTQGFPRNRCCNGKTETDVSMQFEWQTHRDFGWTVRLAVDKPRTSNRMNSSVDAGETQTSMRK